MKDLRNNTTFTFASLGDVDCLEMAFEIVANKIEEEEALEPIEKKFVVQHFRDLANKKKRPGNKVIAIDKKLAVFRKMAKLIDSGMSINKAAENLGEVNLEGESTFIREPRSYINIYNDMKRLGWKHP